MKEKFCYYAFFFFTFGAISLTARRIFNFKILIIMRFSFNKIFYIILFAILLFGCVDGSFDPNKPPPSCEWNDTDDISLIGLQLRYPNGLSNFHQIQTGGINGFDLITVLETKGDAFSENRAKASADIKASGRTCIGQESVSYKAGATEVGPVSIQIPIVTNVIFDGEVTVGIRTDSYQDTNGNSNYYHIMWNTTTNDYPYSQLNSDLMGVKTSYLFEDETSTYVDPVGGYVIRNGIKNFM